MGVPISEKVLEGLPGRAIRAARLDGSLYVEVRADNTVTAQALAIVAIVAIAHGLGGVTRGAYFGWNPLSGLLFGVLGEVSFFAAASCVIYLVARHALGSSVAYTQVLRSFGFSVVPGLLIFVAALVSLLGTGVEVPVLLLTVVWRLAAGFVAVRQASGISASKSLLALLAGVASGLVAVAIASRALVEVLAFAGVSG